MQCTTFESRKVYFSASLYQCRFMKSADNTGRSNLGISLPSNIAVSNSSNSSGDIRTGAATHKQFGRHLDHNYPKQ
jgi:hypothetical protein